ncbi:hypothetical protein C7T35_10485 [Variovorax sp. WS11]|uniref:hypothetical protein n=1 Tax=Variovorax sp. WS11 TaxID=1105204 RepID=UPI000D0D2491|nr:hypothetical protein [Variovorax sp. WS11]NDZ12780.1 hypothetical protein [Variovorax sp. WS11]PSL84713.1 hypothetical protein C7T35_10485 [Variovorax sp. WS11]
MTSFDNFRFLNPESADLARELVDASERQRSAFSSFSNAWMAFNGWMECVTEAETDAAMITALADHRRVGDAYTDLLRNDSEFEKDVMTFAAMLPVLNVRDVRRKLGRDAFLKWDRAELLDEVSRATVKHQPVGWVKGSVPTWPQILRAMYAVRCNLFHGSKSSENSRDHAIVVACERILRRFIDRTKCFEWHD